MRLPRVRSPSRRPPARSPTLGPAGKMDAKKRLEGCVGQAMSANIVQCMGAMLDTIVF